MQALTGDEVADKEQAQRSCGAGALGNKVSRDGGGWGEVVGGWEDDAGGLGGTEEGFDAQAGGVAVAEQGIDAVDVDALYLPIERVEKGRMFHFAAAEMVDDAHDRIGSAAAQVGQQQRGMIEFVLEHEVHAGTGEALKPGPIGVISQVFRVVTPSQTKQLNLMTGTLQLLDKFAVV
jgi:hypothetical protein